MQLRVGDARHISTRTQTQRTTEKRKRATDFYELRMETLVLLFAILLLSFLSSMRENFSYNLVKALEIKKEHFLDVIVHNFYQKEIIFKPNIFPRNPGGTGVFCLGNPDNRGSLVLQKIQVRQGVKKRPHPSGGVDFFWNNPMETLIPLIYLLKKHA